MSKGEVKAWRADVDKYCKPLAMDYLAWIYFVFRIICNLMIIYFVIIFLKSWVVFTFSGLSISAEFVNASNTAMWGICILFLFMRMTNTTVEVTP